MKETTKPNTKQSHLLKRDLAENIAVLPLPTPPAGARGEGRGLVTPLIDLQFPQFVGIAARRDEPLSLSQGTDTILTLTTDFRLTNV
jgi:hypothetical protein